jgi:dTDP-4-dehydrorhamnose reductase
MNIVVVGATGMLGQALLREGARRGNKPIGLARNYADYNVNITDSGKLVRTLEQIRPDVVINAAAVTSLAECEQDANLAYFVNARSVAILADICAKMGIYLVQISTDHYFVNDRDAKHAETSPICLVNEYARTKYAGEVFALTCSGTLVVRTNIVGFRGKGQPTFIEWAIAALESEERITLFEDFFTSSIHVDGFAAALFDILPKKIAGTLNLAAREVSSKKEFICLLADELRIELANTTSGSVSELCGPRRAESLGLDVDRAERLLGYKLPTTREVIGALVQQYRESIL